ncbi:MAG: four helix bundle protein [Bacteroidales bacterium]|nr:four helix bundle protein [Bacteroidales bacterium]
MFPFQSDKEFTHFLYIALGSLAEPETQIIISKELNYIDSNEEELDRLNYVKKLLLGVIKYLKNK